MLLLLPLLPLIELSLLFLRLLLGLLPNRRSNLHVGMRLRGARRRWIGLRFWRAHALDRRGTRNRSGFAACRWRRERLRSGPGPTGDWGSLTARRWLARVHMERRLTL